MSIWKVHKNRMLTRSYLDGDVVEDLSVLTTSLLFYRMIIQKVKATVLRLLDRLGEREACS